MFATSPDYLYALDQGLRQTLAAASAGSIGTLGGGVMRQLQREGQGLATQNLNNWRSGLSNLWTAGSATANYLGNKAVEGAGQQNDYRLGAANARASAYQQQGKAWSGAVQSVGDIAGGIYRYDRGLPYKLG